MQAEHQIRLCTKSLLYEGAFISVVYFYMEKVLLYWSVDQYKNVQKLVESKEGCHVARWQESVNITSVEILYFRPCQLS